MVGTPITNVHYLNAHEGCIYGLDHPIERFQPETSAILRPETDIEGNHLVSIWFSGNTSFLLVTGLYLSGQDIMSCGFSSALYAGMLCASSVIGRNLYFDLIALHKKLRAQSK